MMIYKPALIVLLLMISAPVMAQDKAESFSYKGAWQFSWGGISFSRLWIAIEPKGATSTLTASFKSKGLIRIFKSMKSLTVAQIDHLGAGICQTREMKYDNPDESKHVYLTFNAKGEQISRSVKPEDDPNYRPPIDTDRLKGVTTPGDALCDLQQAVKDAELRGTNDFSLKFYDGQRLMRDNGTLGKTLSYPLNEQEVKVRSLTLTRELIDGFTPKELARYHEGEPPVTLYMRVVDRFPIAMEVPVKLGILRAEWRGEE